MARTLHLTVTVDDEFIVADAYHEYGSGRTLRSALMRYAKNVASFLEEAAHDEATGQPWGKRLTEQRDAYRALATLKKVQ